MSDHLDKVTERPTGKVCQFFELIPQTKLKGHLENRRKAQGVYIYKMDVMFNCN